MLLTKGLNPNSTNSNDKKCSEACLHLPTSVQALSSLSMDLSDDLDVLGKDGNTFGMDGAQVDDLNRPNRTGLEFF